MAYLHPTAGPPVAKALDVAPNMSRVEETGQLMVAHSVAVVSLNRRRFTMPPPAIRSGENWW